MKPFTIIYHRKLKILGLLCFGLPTLVIVATVAILLFLKLQYGTHDLEQMRREMPEYWYIFPLLYGGFVVLFAVPFLAVSLSFRQCDRIWRQMGETEQQELMRVLDRYYPKLIDPLLGKYRSSYPASEYRRIGIGSCDWMSNYILYGESKYFFQPALLRLDQVIWVYLVSMPFRFTYHGDGYELESPMTRTVSAVLVTRDGRKHRISFGVTKDVQSVSDFFKGRFGRNVIIGYGREQKELARERIRMSV